MPSVPLFSYSLRSFHDFETSSFNSNILSLIKRTEASHSQSATVPTAAIVGGAVGGFFIAVAAVVGWILCGRCLRRGRAKPRKASDTEAYRKRRNTLKHSRRPTDDAILYGPLLSLPRPSYFPEKGERDDSPTPVGTPIMEGKELELPVITPLKVSKPKPLRTKRQLSQQSMVDTRTAMEDGTQMPALAHKPSAISTSSMYSTASGEERALQMPPSLLLAALDEEGSDVPHRVSRALPPLPDRRSMASSKRSFLSRIPEGVPDRLSHASSHQSMFTAASRDSSGAKVGLAL